MAQTDEDLGVVAFEAGDIGSVGSAVRPSISEDRDRPVGLVRDGDVHRAVAGGAFVSPFDVLRSAKVVRAGDPTGALTL